MAGIDFSTDRKPLMSFAQAGLADIVLLLLIFFLLTSSFIPQFGIRVNLPETSAQAPSDPVYVSVAITADGAFYVEQNRVPREGLLDAVQNAVGDRSAMLIRADRDATVDQFATVASIAQALNLRVQMASERAGRRR
ncbi:MAG: biopolymer transporter ExbD [Rhodothermales bacterium]|nr:biopolymer transporter ExbD [Rhodothermales bacterium]MBO6779759.1 biopolymer transporter ExbD [Rhodothermales bacterium]